MDTVVYGLTMFPFTNLRKYLILAQRLSLYSVKKVADAMFCFSNVAKNVLLLDVADVFHAKITLTSSILLIIFISTPDEPLDVEAPIRLYLTK